MVSGFYKQVFLIGVVLASLPSSDWRDRRRKARTFSRSSAFRATGRAWLSPRSRASDQTWIFLHRRERSCFYRLECRCCCWSFPWQLTSLRAALAMPEVVCGGSCFRR